MMFEDNGPIHGHSPEDPLGSEFLPKKTTTTFCQFWSIAAIFFPLNDFVTVFPH